MQTATLIVSSLALVTSGTCLAILVRFAKEGKALQKDVETFKGKTERNVGRLTRAITDMEF